MARFPTAPTRPALRYHGGKWRLAKWIISHMPEHVCYCEPFGGGASVLLQKRPAKIEVYNDLGLRVVSFFRILRERPDELIRAIELTPYARAEFEHAREPSDDELEASRRFYILAWQGRGGPTARWNTGWRFQRTNSRSTTALDDWSNIDHLYAVAARLKRVHLECWEAHAVIRRFDAPETLFYVDPPYLASLRGNWSKHAYTHELTKDDHCALADLLHQVRGMVLISHYPCPLYDELYAGWRRVSTTGQTDAASKTTECLWLNPAAAARAPQRTIDDYLDGG